MKIQKTVVLSAQDLNEMVDNCEQGEVEVKIPRKDGELPYAVIKVNGEDFTEALAGTIGVEPEELDSMVVSGKKGGSVQITW